MENPACYCSRHSIPSWARASSPQPGRSAEGFTLIELLVVIAIIAILAALLLPVLSRAKQKGQGVYCLNNGKQVMTALTLYASDYNEFFPPILMTATRSPDTTGVREKLGEAVLQNSTPICSEIPNGASWPLSCKGTPPYFVVRETLAPEHIKAPIPPTSAR
jgi:prepilin-type N-terminal cleavage/methylation domain-containing protein